MTSRPKECETSRYRHGSDPPKRIQTAPSSVRQDQHSSSPASPKPLVRLIELQPSLLHSVFRFHSKQRK